MQAQGSAPWWVRIYVGHRPKIALAVLMLSVVTALMGLVAFALLMAGPTASPGARTIQRAIADVKQARTQEALLDSLEALANEIEHSGAREKLAGFYGAVTGESGFWERAARLDQSQSLSERTRGFSLLLTEFDSVVPEAIEDTLAVPRSESHFLVTNSLLVLFVAGVVLLFGTWLWRDRVIASGFWSNLTSHV